MTTSSPSNHSRPFDRDRLHMMPRERACTGAFLVIDSVQNEEPEAQVAALSIAFAAVMDRIGFDPEEAYRYGRKVLRDQRYHRGANDMVQSMKDFAGLRVKGDPNVTVG